MYEAVDVDVNVEGDVYEDVNVDVNVDGVVYEDVSVEVNVNVLDVAVLVLDAEAGDANIEDDNHEV